MQTGIVFDIQHNSFVDGPGIRTSVFMKGCNLHCSWCHNPESQKYAPELMVFQNKCTHCGKCEKICPHHQSECDLCGSCAAYCPNDARKICGAEYTSEAVMEEIRKDRIFYSASGGGVTFSGGECMLQLDFLRELLMLCRHEHIHTAIDTAGNVPYADLESVLPWTDLILYDIKSMDPYTHKQHTGSSNHEILRNLERLLKEDVSIWIRMPVIPSVNDNDDEMKMLAEFLTRNGMPDKIELLPYHRMGEHKYQATGRKIPVFEVPADEKMAHLNQLLQSLSGNRKEVSGT